MKSNNYRPFFLHCFKLKSFIPLILLATAAQAQVPEGIPNDNSKVSIDSTFDILLYIVLPILMVGYFFWWRNKRKKQG
jgi:hypothetical protein